MVEKTTAPMDDEQARIFGEACASITSSAMDALTDSIRAGVINRLQQGGNLYLHVQMIPEFVVVLALDPGDPAKPNMEIARWSGASSEAVKRVLN